MINKIKKLIKLYGPLALWVLVFNLLLSLFFLQFCKIADSAYNTRACNAGYYNTLPEDMKDPSFTCDK